MISKLTNITKGLRFAGLFLVTAISFFFLIQQMTVCAIEVLKGEATGKVMLNGEPWGTGRLTFTNVSGDATFVVKCEKDVSAGANSATCVGTDVNGFFSGGPNGYAIFGSGSQQITLQLRDGEKFAYSQGGVTAELTVSDPSIFKNWGTVDEDGVRYEPEDYDPNAPLTDSRARAADINGQVEIACPPDFEAWDVLKPGRIIYNHCRLKTGEDSTLRISFSNMTTFVMRPETEVVINESVKEKSNIQLLFGGIWANVKKMARGEEFGFKGSQAVAGIKGTTFILEETKTQTTLKVIEGVVSYTSKVKGESVDVGGGRGVSATANGLSEIKEFDVSSENRYWNDISTRSEDQAPKTYTTIKDMFIPALVGAMILTIMVATLVIFKKKRSDK